MAVQHQYDDDESEVLTIHLGPELHRRIKQAAQMSNMSMSEYVEIFLEQTLPIEPVRLWKQDDGQIRMAKEDMSRRA